MSILVFLLLQIAPAQEQEKSAFEASMEQDTSTPCEESWVLIKGQRYRKYDMKGGLYYVKFIPKNKTTAELYCSPPDGYKTERLIIEQPKDEHRTPAFVAAFHEGCKGVTGKGTLKLNPSIGLVQPETEH